MARYLSLVYVGMSQMRMLFVWFGLSSSRIVNLIQVVIAQGFHLFPFRTEKLSPVTPMVLRERESR